LICIEEEQLDEIGKGNGKEKGKEKPEKKVASNGAGTNTARLRQRIKIVTAKTDGQKKANENFRIFFHVLEEDHSLPDLIWNQQTRHELKSVIELELKFIDEQTKINGGIEKIAWNHQQFMVPYSCLKSEVRVGTIYMRLWLQTGDSFIKSWNNPLRLFELLFRRLLCDLDRDNEVTNMCICCLERLYTIHALKIGPFPDIMILMQSMVKTRCIETQHRLLGLITALMGGTKSQSKDNKVTNVAANAEQLMNDECISYLCHFIAWGHLHSEQFDSGVENTISDKTSNVPAMWYIAPPGKIPPLPESIEGPFFVKDLRDLFAKGVVLPQSLVTTSIVNDYSQTHASPVLKDSCLEKGNWRILDEVWQLRWQLLTDHNLSPCVHSPSKIASMALSCLNSIVSVHQSVDSRGIPFFPIPVAKRLICGQSGGSDPVGKATNKPNLKKQSLSIICQAFLCNDSDVVETAADLITKIMDHNEEACAKLYLTGIFYFALLYTGSNFRPIAQLIYETHMKQKFYNTTSNDIIVEDRSILENMLPEGLLKVLSNHGAEKFTDVFKGDFDTPEGEVMVVLITF
jgi:DnaJ family protein C protein 13